MQRKYADRTVPEWWPLATFHRYACDTVEACKKVTTAMRDYYGIEVIEGDVQKPWVMADRALQLASLYVDKV